MPKLDIDQLDADLNAGRISLGDAVQAFITYTAEIQDDILERRRTKGSLPERNRSLLSSAAAVIADYCGDHPTPPAPILHAEYVYDPEWDTLVLSSFTLTYYQETAGHTGIACSRDINIPPVPDA